MYEDFQSDKGRVIYFVRGGGLFRGGHLRKSWRRRRRGGSSLKNEGPKAPRGGHPQFLEEKKKKK